MKVVFVIPIDAGEHNPIVPGQPLDGAVELLPAFGRRDLNDRQFDDLGAPGHQALGQPAGLRPAARDNDALAEQRPRFKPVQLFPEPDKGERQQCKQKNETCL